MADIPKWAEKYLIPTTTEVEEMKKDTARIEWLQRNSYAFVIRHDTGKGFMRFSNNYKDQEQNKDEYDVRRAIDNAIKGIDTDVQK